MINVGNSYRRRIFISRNKKDLSFLKLRVENKIYEIEKNHTDYEQLSSFESEDFSKNISVFIFKKNIVEVIDKLVSGMTDLKFQSELIILKNDVYKILVADFKTIKEYIKNLIDNDSLLIHRGVSKDKSNEFIKYQEEFENLYTALLSTPQDIKRGFFDLFDDVNVCPYCNRNFVNPINKETRVDKDIKNQSPDIEHFYPKSIYPLLSLSISNLLPSCAFCNKIKSNFDTYDNFKSPYEIEDDDFKFKFDSLEVGKRTVKLNTKLNNSKVLHLENLYANVHSQYVNEIYSEINKYPKENREYLNKFFALPFDTQEKLYKKKFCNYYKDSDFNKQSLSKMTKDLFLQIKEDED